ncbi:hypothetical protein [Arthrobacter sp. SLBN-100]|uniref:hypothetical protein n=1 Tax=Arthrobacter sp. SLBN-100 TaxID=2768450 RepID=UPI001151D084|nr:hypothetical protein [Arthrobacter sp. SLBN-100]
MTTITSPQPHIPTGGQFAGIARAEPAFSLDLRSTADLAALATAETPLLARRRAFLQDQLLMVETRQRAIACAAAAHHVLQQHPDAATIIVSVKDGSPVMLSNVLDSAGRILPAHRFGDWADTVIAEIRQERAGALGEIDGVEAAGATLRIDIAAVVAGAADEVAGQYLYQPKHDASAIRAA